MPSPIFCCGAIEPFRPKRLDHEAKFTSFMNWARYPKHADAVKPQAGLASTFAIQLVRQVNYGPVEWTKYFIPSKSNPNDFEQVLDDDLIHANFQKVNTYKNYRCATHNKFFEVNVYQKDPVNRHHWRANLARPARDIDLEHRQVNPAPTSDSAAAYVASSGPSVATGDVIQSPRDIIWSRNEWITDSGIGGRGFGYDRDDSPVKDYTACDKECGYCGQCDY